MNTRRGLIVLAHGSRSATANAEVVTLCTRLQAVGAAERVGAAFLGTAPPSLEEAASAQIEAGLVEIAVLPLLLVSGMHVREDVPRLVSAARARWPGVDFRVLEHVGAGDAFADFVASRAAAGWATTPDAEDD